jgi:hypothetical protein
MSAQFPVGNPAVQRRADAAHQQPDRLAAAGLLRRAYYLVPEESEREIHSPKLAWLQLAILVLGTAGVV